MAQIKSKPGRPPAIRVRVARTFRLIANSLTAVGIVLSALLPLVEHTLSVAEHGQQRRQGTAVTGTGGRRRSLPAQTVGKVRRAATAAAATTTDARDTGIPRSLVFTYRHNILNTKEPSIYFANVQRTIQEYRKLWNEEDAPVRFLDDSACREAIQRAEPRLVPRFDNETEGKFKADICRVADLYLNGGYYFDVDLRVVQPLPLSSAVTFATVHDFSKQHFFQAFLAAQAGNPILREAFRIMLAYYDDTHPIRGENMGTSTLKDAFDAVDESVRGTVRLLIETNNVEKDYDGNQNLAYYPDLPKQGSHTFGPSCDQIVHDPHERIVYFYSKLIGSGLSCRNLDMVVQGEAGGGKLKQGSLMKSGPKW